jgi:hypothetical protein
MPTPSPMSAPKIGARSMTFMTCVSRMIPISPLTTPAVAVTRGSSIASSDPNAMNSTTAAASTPTAELTDSGGCSVL